jgi:hypothetical protein
MAPHAHGGGAVRCARPGGRCVAVGGAVRGVGGEVRCGGGGGAGARRDTSQAVCPGR